MRSLIIASLLCLGPWAAIQAETQNIPLSHKSSGTLYVQTQVGAQEQTGWLVDTGSDYSVIGVEAINELLNSGQAKFLTKLRGKMADGSERIIPLYKVDRIQLAGNCEVRDVKVAVLPKSTRRIMGLSALRQLAPFSVSFDPPMLTVNGCLPTTAALQNQSIEKHPAIKKPPTHGADGSHKVTQ